MLVNNVRLNRQISFRAKSQEEIDRIKERCNSLPDLEKNYAKPESKSRTITILGSSRTDERIRNYMNMAKIVAGELVKRGYNVVTGCGDSGVMGEAYKAASEASLFPNSGKNLAIIKMPPWGDENLDDCIPIGKSPSESDRIDKFGATSKAVLAFPGGATTIQEISTFIAKKKYSKGDESPALYLVGKKFYNGLDDQYQIMTEEKTGTLGKTKPEDLYKLVDSVEEILKDFPPLNQK